MLSTPLLPDPTPRVAIDAEGRAVGELPVFGLLGLSVEDDLADRARQLITAYNGAFPLSDEEPDNYPDVLLC